MSDVDTHDEGGAGDAPQHDPALLQEAADLGWVPLERWKHDPEDWVDADQYVKRGREVRAFLSKSLQKANEKNARLQAELDELKKQVNGVDTWRKDLDKKVFEQAQTNLKQQIRAARDAGDTAAEDAAEEQLDSLRKSYTEPSSAPPTPVQQQQQAEHPAFKVWKVDNDWYGTDEEKTTYADAVFLREVGKAKKSGVRLDPEEALATVSAAVARQFGGGGTRPAMFERTGGGSGGSGRGSSKGFNSLPPDAKQTFERYFADGYYPGMKKEEAQKQYYSDYSGEA